MDNTNGRLSLMKPVNDLNIEQWLRLMHKEQKWILIAPDGRVWEHKELHKMLAVVVANMNKDPLTFDLSNVVG